MSNEHLTMGGLFSGIGGFELAGIWAGIVPVWSNDIDRHCCENLSKNFNHEIIEKDIKKLQTNELQAVDIICGGDPCQPSSIAGLQKGTFDDRYLWPEMFRIIRELHPSFVINENVNGTIANGILDLKVDDLEGEGYTCQAYIIPAEAVGAAHRRDRVWLVGLDPNQLRQNRKSQIFHCKKKKKGVSKRDDVQHPGEPVNLWPFGTYPHPERLQKQYDAAQSGGLSEGVSRYFGFGPFAHGHITSDIIKSGIIRMLDGLPAGMDYPERNKRLAALGNAIVPQVAYEFFRWMISVVK
jgi:site-specific DNA-cytosine methylase